MKNGILEIKITDAILENLSSGLAIFGANDLSMKWYNSAFRKQTWFGGAKGGKGADAVLLTDLFNSDDQNSILELFNIAISIGKSYDFERRMRRGLVGYFPAELKFRRVGNDNKGEYLISLEISDLSINNLFEELKNAHVEMQNKLADLMAAQAEINYSIRMNTLSEFGADLAHALINPTTMCRDIILNDINQQLIIEKSAVNFDKILHYLKDIEDFAISHVSGVQRNLLAQSYAAA